MRKITAKTDSGEKHVREAYYNLDNRPVAKHQNAESLSRRDFEQTGCNQAGEDTEIVLTVLLIRESESNFCKK